MTHPKSKLIKSTKSDVGRIALVKIDCINKAMRFKFKLMHWTDTDQVLNRFTGLKNKSKASLSF